MIHAAGILFETPDGQHLFLKRSGEGDHAGQWGLPGGKVEDGETADAASRRETVEETGFDPGENGRSQLARLRNAEVDYTTFHQPVTKPFEVHLNEEHTDSRWATPAEAPTPLHPGLKAVLEGVSARGDATPKLAKTEVLPIHKAHGSFSIVVNPTPRHVEQLLTADHAARGEGSTRALRVIRSGDDIAAAPAWGVTHTDIARTLHEVGHPMMQDPEAHRDAMSEAGHSHMWISEHQDGSKHVLGRGASATDSASWPAGMHRALGPGKPVARADTATPAGDVDELTLARDIRDGKLPSPQRYHNIHLFALRITGTGASYREGLDEYVWRKPDIYMNDDFLERCQGLPVIMLHPDKNQLDSSEFRERVVGTIMLPYLKEDEKEVWGIAKIFDDDAVRLMGDRQLSTSPAVVFTKPGAMQKHQLEDGASLLIEGKPGLLDHLAICEQGVWDKGGEPAGVDSTSTQDHEGGSPVADKEDDKKESKAEEKATEKKEEARDDSAARLDALIAKADAIQKRLDDLEGGAPLEGDEAEGHELEQQGNELIEEGKQIEQEGDKLEHESRGQHPAEAVADAARKDAAVARRENADLRNRLAALEKRIPVQLSDADYAALSGAQASADQVYAAFGDAAPRPLQGESLLAYRQRLTKGLQKHSPGWDKVDLGLLPEPAFAIAESQIRADALTAARNPTDLGSGELREMVTIDPTTGRRMVSFAGEPRSWMSQFMGPGQRVERFNRKQREQ